MFASCPKPYISVGRNTVQATPWACAQALKRSSLSANFRASACSAGSLESILVKRLVEDNATTCFTPHATNQSRYSGNTQIGARQIQVGMFGAPASDFPGSSQATDPILSILCGRRENAATCHPWPTSNGNSPLPTTLVAPSTPTHGRSTEKFGATPCRATCSSRTEAPSPDYGRRTACLILPQAWRDTITAKCRQIPRATNHIRMPGY